MAQSPMGLETATVHVNGDRIAITTAEGDRSYAVREMPDELFPWQLDSHWAVFEAIANGIRPADFHASEVFDKSPHNNQAGRRITYSTMRDVTTSRHAVRTSTTWASIINRPA